MLLTAGSTIGGCVLHERLGGESGDVAVFRATDGDGASVVVKVPLLDEVKPVFLQTAKSRANAAERGLLARHSNIVRTLRFGVERSGGDSGGDPAGDNGTPYLIQEFVAGPTLANLPAEMSLWQRVRCGVEAADALEFLHSQGVVHCGAVRAKHFRLDANARVRLVDLGNAYSGGLPPLPEPGQLGQRATDEDVQADVLAYGAVLRDLLTPGAEDSATLRSIISECLEENPSKRVQNLRVVSERLRAWVDSYPASKPKVEPVRQSFLALPKSTKPKSLFESSWTFLVLSLSLASVVGATVEVLSPRTLLAPIGRDSMVAVDGGSLLVDFQPVREADYVAFARRTGRTFAKSRRSDGSAVGVNAFDAAEYCEFMGKRLPTVSDYALISGSGVALRPGAAEWIGERAIPDLFSARSFPTPLFPQPRVSEEWRRIHGAPASLAGHSFAPARFAAVDIGFRCVAPAK